MALAQTTVTWTGAAGNGLYSDPANWNPQVVPVNSGLDEFDVVIPTGLSVSIDAAIPAAFAVSALDLAAGSNLNLSSGHVMTVGDDGMIQGTVTVSNSSQLIAS